MSVDKFDAVRGVTNSLKVGKNDEETKHIILMALVALDKEHLLVDPSTISVRTCSPTESKPLSSEMQSRVDEILKELAEITKTQEEDRMRDKIDKVLDGLPVGDTSKTPPAEQAGPMFTPGNKNTLEGY